MFDPLIKTGGGLVKYRGGLMPHRGGLLSGINPSLSATPIVLTTLDFSTLGDGNRVSTLATDQWLMQDAASPLANSTGSETLASDTGTLQNAALGIWSGSDFISVDCWKSGATAANSDTLVASGTTAGDSAGTDLAFRLEFKMDQPPVNGDVFLGKYPIGAGWALYYGAGTLNLVIHDGTLSATLTTTVLASLIGNTGWHYISGFYDVSANTTYLRGDLFTEVTKDTSVVTGSIAAAPSFQINGWNGASATTGHPNMSGVYGGTAVGANARAFYDEVPASRLGVDPTGQLSTISLPAATTVTISGAADTALVSANQVAVAYNANFSNTTKIGLLCSNASSTDWRTVGSKVSEDTGQLTATFVMTALPGAGNISYVFDTLAASDRRALRIDETGALSFLVNDSAGSLVAEVTLGTIVVNTEYVAICQWDEAAGLDGASVRAKVNAVAKVTGGAAFTSGAGFTAELCLGASGGTVNTRLDGLLQSLPSLDGAEAMAA